jgi:hypothetical protein
MLIMAMEKIFDRCVLLDRKKGTAVTVPKSRAL